MKRPDLFDRAALLGVVVAFDGFTADDLERLLEAVHAREGALMLLRHAITRALCELPPPSEPP